MTNWNYEAAARLAARLASSSRSSRFVTAAGAAHSSASAGAAAATKTKPRGPQWCAPRPTARGGTSIPLPFSFGGGLPSSPAGLCTAAFKSSSSSHSNLVQVARREFSSRAQLWDNLTLPSRRGQQQELSLVANLLPHRATFTAQFLPHGIQLIPKVISAAHQQQQQHQAAGKGVDSPNARQHAPAIQPATPANTKKRSSTLHDWCAEEEHGAQEEEAASLAGADDARLGSKQAAAALDHPGKAWRRLQTRRLKLRRRNRKGLPGAPEAGASCPPTP